MSDEGLEPAPPARNVRDYALVTACYWVFTLTDGALRMLVLLYLHEQGFTPIAIASMFLLYEVFGIVTTFFGGWIGARFGLKSILVAGLATQVVACGMLAVDAALLSVAWVMVAQGLAGIAKDLTKTSSKSYIKLVVPSSDHGGLMKWVALLTGSKNALKGVGFFLGGVLLGTVGLKGAVLGMAAALFVTLLVAAASLPRAAGKRKTKVALGELIARDPRINWLSAARLFLFGSRDAWFVLAVPIFLSTELGWSHSGVGGFLALWVIGYGVVQASAPAFVGAGRDGGARLPDAARLARWSFGLVVPLGAIAFALSRDLAPELALVVGLGVFGVVFAANSAIHSYLIVAYSPKDDVALRVGFYYMANAVGRLAGTILSGSVFQLAGEGSSGLVACILASIVMVTISGVMCLPLRRAEALAR